MLRTIHLFGLVILLTTIIETNSWSQKNGPQNLFVSDIPTLDQGTYNELQLLSKRVNSAMVARGYQGFDPQLSATEKTRLQRSIKNLEIPLTDKRNKIASNFYEQGIRQLIIGRFSEESNSLDKELTIEYYVVKNGHFVLIDRINIIPSFDLVSEPRNKKLELVDDFIVESIATYENLHKEPEALTIQQEENIIWENAGYFDDINTYDGYLRKFPNGRYVKKARSRKSELETDSTNHFRDKDLYFPFPPPKPSASQYIPFRDFPSMEKLEDVSIFLLKALELCGYKKRKFYKISKGFALVTQIEKITGDATSKDPPERWEVEQSNSNEFSLKDLFNALFYSTPGYYRIIVFIVTDIDREPSQYKLDKKEAMGWLYEGADDLPSNLGTIQIDEDYYCKAFIYEFKSPDSGRDAILMDPSDHLGIDHLKRSNLWNQMKK